MKAAPLQKSNVGAAGAERLLAADEWRVRRCGREGGRARVHEVAKEFPAGGHLEVRDAELLSD